MAAAQPLRLGILGAARIAPNAVIKPTRENAGLSAEVVVAAVAARSLDKAKAFATEHAVPLAYGSYEELLADTSIDCVYNALPNGCHAEWTIKALRSGKHVLCEKPFTNNADEVRAVIEASQASGCLAVEAFHVIHHPLALRTREIVASGTLGQLQHVDIQFLANFAGYDEDIRSAMHVATPMFEDVRFNLGLGGGVNMDLGGYCIRVLRHATGAELECTGAVATPWDRDPEIDLAMSADFALPLGATAHYDASFVAGERAGPLKVTIRGADQTATVLGYTGSNQGNSIVLTATSDGSKIGEESLDGPFPNSRGTMYYQLKDFAVQVNARRSGRDLPARDWSCLAEDAVLNMASIDAVYTAAGLKPRPSMASLL